MSKPVATSFGVPWTARSAEIAFTSSNIVGLSAATFLLAAAIQDIKRPSSDLHVSVVVFPCLFLLDLCFRYPLLVGNWSTRLAVILFLVYYVVIASVAAYPWMKEYTALFSIVLAALVLTWLVGTREKQEMYHS
jgi:hypothetical protein